MKRTDLIRIACRLKYFLLFIGSLLLSCMSFAQVQTQKAVAVNIGTNIGGYYESLPVNYDSAPTKKFPLIIFMHGAGEVGNGTTQITRVAANGIPKLISQGKFPSKFTVDGEDFSFLVMSPQCKYGDYPIVTIAPFLSYVLSHYRVDEQRIYLTGLSLGGYMSWNYAAATEDYAKKLAALLLVCPGIDTVKNAGTPDPHGYAKNVATANLPTWITTNSVDNLAYTFKSVALAKFINEYNPTPPAKLTVFPAVGHDAWTQTYDPNYKEDGLNVYEWMLKYKRGSASPSPPIANAGSSQTITLPTNSITLNGTASTAPSGTITNYLWTKISGPSSGTISSPSASVTSVSILTEGTYQFQLTVTDNNGKTGTAVVSITVKPAPLPPVANAGSPQTITLPTNSITLNGSASTAPSGSITSYQWTKLSGPASGVISNAGSAITTVTGLTEGVYVFQLKITDNNSASSTASVSVTVNAAPVPPIAVAGDDQTIRLPVNSVSLDGTKSTAPSGTITQYIWVKVSGPSNGIINNNSSAVTSVSNLTEGVYEFQLTVKDNLGSASTDIVSVIVKPAPAPPIANAGDDKTIQLPFSTISLDGSGSKAIEGSITNYEWLKISGPTSGVITDPNAVSTNVTNLVEGIYVFQLKITDSNGNTALATVSITVKPAPLPPVANAGPNTTITLPVNTAVLDGTASAAPSGSISSYQWTKISGPSSGSIVNASAATTNVNGLAEGVYQFELKVTDNNGASSTSIVTITVKPALLPPVANAGGNITITLPQNSITLDGSASSAPSGYIVSYVWKKLSGPADGIIANTTSAITAVNSLAKGTYNFELTVKDNNEKTAKAVVIITVNPEVLPPVSNAGADQTITLPANTITLDGSTSNAPSGTIVSYLWSKVSGPSSGTIVNSSTATTAVNGLVEGVYEFQLQVTDDKSVTASDIVIITVKPAPLPPVANAGANQTITLPQNTITLDGTASTAPSGNIVSYQWIKVSGPADGVIENNTNSITSVNNLSEGVYVFELKVTDNNASTSTSSVTITVKPAPLPPVANAGADQTISLPQNLISLDGTGSVAPSGTITSYTWIKKSGPATGTIANNNIAKTDVSGLTEGVYVFELTVVDNNGLSSSATVTITVNAAPLPPVANAGKDTSITLPQNSLVLDGTASNAPAGSIDSYLWTKISGPSGGDIATPGNATSNVNNLTEGVYKFRLKITDNNNATSTATVTVTVLPAPLPPVANAGSAQTIELPNDTFTLDGSKSSASSGSIVSYGWTKISGPSTGTITTPAAAVTTVAGVAEGVYQFELKITDSNGLTSTATVTITVNPAPLPPVANAGSAQTIQLPVNSIVLDGTKSTASSGSIVSYEWSKISGPSGAAIVDISAGTTTVNNLIEGVYTFELKVTDNKGKSATATVSVTVKAAPVPPVAIAGSDKTITLPQNNVTLDGSLSTGNIISYSWVKVSGPSEGNITDSSKAKATAINLIEGVYKYQLEVKDNNGLTATATVTVIVKPALLPPVANAGNDIVITLPVSSVTLDGSASIAPSGTIVAFEWTKVSGPAPGVINTPSVAATIVNGLNEGLYLFELKITDNNGAISRDTVNINVKAALLPPVADAGGDKTITLPQDSATLDGTLSAAPSGTISSYTWTKVSGPGAGSISNPASASTTVTGLLQGVYKFQLKVTDDHGMSATDIITITVNPALLPPVANAGNAQTIVLPLNTVVLDGSKSTASSGTIVSYSWSKISGPSGDSINDAAKATTQLSGLSEGTYIYELIVTDSNGANATATVTIIVKASPPPPVADAGNAQTIVLPIDSATLDGSKSTAPAGSIVSFEWSIVSGPQGATISDTAAKVTVIHGLTEGSYQVQLKVTDNLGKTTTASVSITVKAAPVPPVADAGTAQTITLPDSVVQLDATKSIAPAGQIKSYLWTKISGPSSGVITNSGAALTYAEGLVAGVYQFQVKVTDDNGKSSTAIVTITVNPAPAKPPVANAGEDFTIQLPVTAVQLDGSKSYAREGSIKSYHWVLLGGTTPLNILNATTATPSILSIEPGMYVFRLFVTDTYGSRDSADIAVKVLAENIAPQPPHVNILGDTTVTLPQTELALDGSSSFSESGIITRYEWSIVSGPSGAIFENSSSAITKLTGLTEGEYKIKLKVTDSNGGLGETTISVVVNNAGGRQDLSTMANIYPNPTRSLVNIQLKNIKQKGRTMLDLYDVNGKRVLHKEIIKDDVYFNQQIDLSGLNKGVYFLEIIIDYQYRIAHRIVKL